MMMNMFTSKGCVARCTFCQRGSKGYVTYDLDKLDEYLTLLKEKYNSHVFNESYVEVFPWEGYASADESISEKYIEFGIESFHEFLSSIRSEYIKEETESTGDGYSEIKESKKTNVIINEIKLLGTFAKTKDRRQQLSIYIAYNYGFEFEQATDTPISGAIITTSSKITLLGCGAP